MIYGLQDNAVFNNKLHIFWCIEGKKCGYHNTISFQVTSQSLSQYSEISIPSFWWLFGELPMLGLTLCRDLTRHGNHFFLWHIRTWFLLKSALSCCALGCDSLAQRVQIKWNRLESLNIGHTGSKCLSFTYQSTRNRVDTFSASPIWIVWEICTLMFKKLLKIQKWSKMDALLMWQGKHTEVHEKNKDIILWPTVCM